MSHHHQFLQTALGRALELERRRAPSLKARIANAPEGDYRNDLERHLAQTLRHQRLLRRHYEAMDGAPTESLLETAAHTATGLVAKAYGLATRPLGSLLGSRDESVLEGAQEEARTGAELIGAYLALERIAANIGETDVSHLARELHKEEQWMLGKLGDHIPELAGQQVPPTVTEVSDRAAV